MSRLRWPDSTNEVSEKPGTIQSRVKELFLTDWSLRPISLSTMLLGLLAAGPATGQSGRRV